MREDRYVHTLPGINTLAVDLAGVLLFVAAMSQSQLYVCVSVG